MTADYDICIIGGGINGAGIARDAAGRGLKVLLLEAQDLAGSTSSASTKLVHGGLRYLEQYEFKLVRESLIEREILLQLAPQIIWPMDFVMPHAGGVRPFWFIRLGLFIYDRLGGRKILSSSKAIDFTHHPFKGPLKPLIRKGITYQDCWAEDARLVVLNAADAKRLGGDILTYTACIGMISIENNMWSVRMKDMSTGDEATITSRMVINVAGPWVYSVLEASGLTHGTAQAPHVRLVKGSHIIVSKLYDGDHAYILQQLDKRIVFAIPYEKKFTLIGTTDVEYDGNPNDVMCSDEEIEYLCNAINIFFDRRLSPSEVLWTYSGVRPLVDDGSKNASKITRDYRFHIDVFSGSPLLSVFGGKLTTYRTLSQQAVDMICKTLAKTKKSWTSNQFLPGGDVRPEKFEEFILRQINHFNWLSADTVRRYARAYGTRMNGILGHATSVDQLGRHFGDDIYEAEVLYVIRFEFVKKIDDFLWRRSKLGMHVSPETVYLLEQSFPDLLEKAKKL